MAAGLWLCAAIVLAFMVKPTALLCHYVQDRYSDGISIAIYVAYLCLLTACVILFYVSYT